MEVKELSVWKAQCGNCGGTGRGQIVRNTKMEFESLPCLACSGKGYLLIKSPGPICEPVYTSSIPLIIETIDIVDKDN